jgi:hypothetical protein
MFHSFHRKFVSWFFRGLFHESPNGDFQQALKSGERYLKAQGSDFLKFPFRKAPITSPTARVTNQKTRQSFKGSILKKLSQPQLLAAIQ